MSLRTQGVEMNSKQEQDFKSLLHQIGNTMEPNSAHQQRLRRDMLSVYHETAQKHTGKSAGVDWRALMKNPLTKMSIAAILLIALIILLQGLGSTSVAIGKMLERMAQMDYTYHHQWIITQEQGDPAVINSLIYKSQNHGIRQELMVGGEPLSTVYIPKDSNSMIQLLHLTQQVITTVMGPQQMAEIQHKTDPTFWIKEALKFKHTDLEPQDFNGVMVEGIEIDDPNYMAMLFEQATCRIWVNVDSQLPVRIEVHGTSDNGKMVNDMVASDFDWQVQLAPQIFEPNIPTGYKIGVPLQASDAESAALDSLRAFADLTGGQYPSQLNLMDYMQEAFPGLMLSRFKDPNAEYPTHPKLPFTSQDLQTMASLKHMGVFYGKLMADCNEVAYYGEKVMPQHRDMVLLRWREDEEHYKVIFGDLVVAQVTPEELVALEQNPDFLALLKQPRPIMPLFSHGPSICGAQDDWLLTDQGTFEITSEIQMVMWNGQAGYIDVNLPYQAGVLNKVLYLDQEVSFTNQGKTQYRIDLPTQDFNLGNSHFTCIWTLPLTALQPLDNGDYQVRLQGMMPILNYGLTLELGENCGFVNAQEPDKKSWKPFFIQNNLKPSHSLGTCGLGIRPIKE